VLRQPQGYGDGRGHLTVVIDCADLDRAGTFWAAVLGYVPDGEVEGNYLSLVPRDGVGVEVMLQRVPEAKMAKNRVHLDLRTRDLDGETARVRALGATQLTAEPILEYGWTWHILGDPDGNEFCVLQPEREYWEPAG
jgi:predicted enzyme related to lactoylglutathione lyase